MRTVFFLFLNLIIVEAAFSQSAVSGRITDTGGNPIQGANIYIEGTYDGGTSDENGQFSFLTDFSSEGILIISYLTYETVKLPGKPSNWHKLEIVLKEDLNTLETVVLSAGSFSAGDNSKINALKPLDVVTTASALGDFVGALQSLPGTTTVAEDGRLFIRGGLAEETHIFIDGIRVFTPYTPSTSNIPSRGRYSPFLFDGISFSTGGYSAEYGQALSGVLLLNTIDEPDRDKSDIGLMTVGGSLGHTIKWDLSSLSVNASYINLSPYLGVFPDRNQWIHPFETGAGEMVFRKRFNSGLLKFYAAFDTTRFHLIQEDINLENGFEFGRRNSNFYLNSSYRGSFKDQSWSVLSGLSLTLAKDKFDLQDDGVIDNSNSLHAKFRLKKRFSSRFKLSFGAEHFVTDFDEEFMSQETGSVGLGFNNQISALFTESDVFISKDMAFKAGLRLEYGSLLNELYLSPRLSYALKTGKKGQLSLAYGQFTQVPFDYALKFDDELSSQEVSHYILNYQFNNEGRVFRAEAYYKDYSNLLNYADEFPGPDTEFNNDGFGYARGLDLFWRDEKSITNLDYWISYSYLDSERLFRNYPVEARPDFINTHNLSVVGKYWVEDWKSQLGFSWNIASGRPYTDPNQEGFHNSLTKAYNSLSLNWAYLIDQQKILYCSVNNVLNTKNINGYQFTNQPDPDGFYASRALRPAADQFFFVGFFWTISTDKSANQLDNL